MKKIDVNRISKLLSYQDYRNLVSEIVLEGKSSDNSEEAELLEYFVLNDARMNRLDKTMQISSENEAYLKAISNKYCWYVLSEGWCGDAAQLLPIMNKMAAFSDVIDFKIVLRDENEVLMNQFLTNGGKAIPKLIVLNPETFEVLEEWGPRPKPAIELVAAYKEKNGVIDETLKKELQMWYLHDKGMSTQNEIIDLMKRIEKQ